MPTNMPNERSIRQPGSMELDPSGEGVSIAETPKLIASNKVEGTAVYDSSREAIGTVYNFKVDKVSGQVAYVVMSFGGILGLGESYHPLPWRALRYDVQLGGYILDVDRDRLMQSPSQTGSQEPFVDDEFGAKVDAYYKIAPTS